MSRSKSREVKQRLVLIVVAVVVLVLVGRGLLTAERYKVLGATTLLARGGDDGGSSGSNSGSGSSGSGSSGSESSGSSDGGSSGTSSSGDNGNSGSGSSENSVSGSTLVVCTGPDGKQFETRFKDCEEPNKAWNKPVNFTSKQTETKPRVEKTEVRLSETERIRTRTEDGRTRVDITSGGIKTRLEVRDDRVVIKAEREDGTEVELEDNTLLKIDDRLAKDNIKVATAGAERLLIQKGTIGAVTDFPVSIDLATNTVFVNTPSGQKKVTILPEQAIQNIVAANVINRLGGEFNNLTAVNQAISLGEKSGVPIYEIMGVSDQKLLGIIPVQIQKEVTVSAETGNALFIQESLVTQFLDAVSF